MYKRIVVERPSEDGLRNRRWEFAVMDNRGELAVVVDIYAIESRPSKRHKFRVEESYYRLAGSRSDAKLTEDEVPLPEDVAAEAKAQVVDLISVGLWKRDFNRR